MKRSPTTTNSPSRRTRFLACVEQRIAAGHSISGQASLSHLPTTSQTQTPPCFALLLRVYLETKPPSGKKKTLATPPDGLTAVLKVPRKQRCTHLHFSRTFFFHLAVSQASVCVWGFFFCYLACEKQWGGSLFHLSLYFGSICWLTWVIGCSKQPGMKGLSITTPISVWWRKLKKKTLVFCVYVRSHYPQPGSLFQCPRSPPPTQIRT